MSKMVGIHGLDAGKASKAFDRKRRRRWRRLAAITSALVLFGTLLVGLTSPSAAAPGDSVIIFDATCENGGGEVLFQINNNGDTATELSLNVGPYTREARVPAGDQLAFPIDRIPDGTYTAQAVFFISVVATKQVVIDCVPDIDTSRLSTPTGVSASLSGETLSFSWNPVSRAEVYSWFLTKDGANVKTGDVTGTRTSTSVTGSGRYCISVQAKAAGLPSSAPSSVTNSSCVQRTDRCASSVRLATPVFGSGTNQRARLEGRTFRADWSDVDCVGEYHYHLTGPQFSHFGATANSVLSYQLPVGSIAGRYCLSLVAVNGGARPDSIRANANGTNQYGCTPEVTNPCVSTTRLATPVFNPGSSSRARFEGNTFKANWGDVACASDYHFHITGPAGFSRYGANSASDVSVSLPVSAGGGRYCVSVVAVNGGARPDSIRLNANGSNAYGCANRAGAQVGQLARPVIDPSPSVFATNDAILFDWGHVAGRDAYHWAAHYPNGDIVRGETTASLHTVRVNGHYDAPICFEVRAVAPHRDSELSRQVCATVSPPATSEIHVCGRTTVAQRYGRPQTGVALVDTDFDCVYVTDGFLIYYNTSANVVNDGRTDRAVIEDLSRKVEEAWEQYGCANVASANTAPVNLDCRTEGGAAVSGWGMQWPHLTANWPTGSRTATEGLRFPVTVGGQGIPADGFSLPPSLQFIPKEDGGGSSSDEFGKEFVLHEVFHTFQWAELAPAQLTFPAVNSAVESMADYAAARAMSPTGICKGECIDPAEYIANGSSRFPWHPEYEGEYWFHYLLDVAPTTQAGLPSDEGPFFNSLLDELGSGGLLATPTDAFERIYGDAVVDDYRAWAAQWP